jgi:hypothetical protein
MSGYDNSGSRRIASDVRRLDQGARGTVLNSATPAGTPFSRTSSGHPPSGRRWVIDQIDQSSSTSSSGSCGAVVEEQTPRTRCGGAENPWTGEILAMCELAYRSGPNEYSSAERRDRRNRAIQDLYEPWSTAR